MRKTKIVGTIGPASDSVETLQTLIEAGLDVARLNFSHGTHKSHSNTLANIREAGKRSGREIAVLQDLCGPKIRTNEVDGRYLRYETGDRLKFCRGKEICTKDRLTCTYDKLVDDLKPGNRVLLDDGYLEFRVVETASDWVECEVVAGGKLKSHKGINLPGVQVSAPSVTEKDLCDLEWGIENGVDFVALSFVRHPDDLELVRKQLRKADCGANLVAKIEKPEAIAHLEEIVSSADAIMIARGDLGVEMPMEEGPILQKRIIELCDRLCKPVITATQMLESMTTRPRPTRAEVSDVANAIIDSTDAIMLSGETASGDFPVEAVRIMSRIAEEAEGYAQFKFDRNEVSHMGLEASFTAAVTLGAWQIAQDVDVDAIAVSTRSGASALALSKHCPAPPVFAFTPDPAAFRRMRLYRGVEPTMCPATETLDEVLDCARNEVIRRGLMEGTLLLVGGVPVTAKGTTNTLRLERIA